MPILYFSDSSWTSRSPCLTQVPSGAKKMMSLSFGALTVAERVAFNSPISVNVRVKSPVWTSVVGICTSPLPEPARRQPTIATTARPTATRNHNLRNTVCIDSPRARELHRVWSSSALLRRAPDAIAPRDHSSTRSLEMHYSRIAMRSSMRCKFRTVSWTSKVHGRARSCSNPRSCSDSRRRRNTG